MEPFLTGIILADTLPTAAETANIKLLLGNDYYCDTLLGDIPMNQVVQD